MKGTKELLPSEVMLVFELERSARGAEAGPQTTGGSDAPKGTINALRDGVSDGAKKESSDKQEESEEKKREDLEAFANSIVKPLKKTEETLKLKERPKVMELIEEGSKETFYEQMKRLIIAQAEKTGDLSNQNALSVTKAVVERYLAELPTTKQTHDGWEDGVVYYGSRAVLEKLQGDLDEQPKIYLENYLSSCDFWYVWQNLMAVVYAHRSPDTAEQGRRLLETIYMPKNPEIIQGLKKALAAPRTIFSSPTSEPEAAMESPKQKNPTDSSNSTPYIS
ncbi:MAG: hypothetical protein LVQ95_02830 [Candidatus Micrarchaeales archaeon]|nr:hypothetical protein [Candidatus Micrarchaeales archaeon]